ncbi:MAG: tetratricopeptide repeat protein [Anaerovoracaceae bacterium]|jgi:tetratricopeptide (TPR) repeat protein
MTENKQSKDRIREYLVPKLDEYLFDELSEDFLRRAGIYDIMHHVPVPIRASDFEGGEISSVRIARNMVFVIGCDNEFPHVEAYRACILRMYKKDFAKPMINEGVEAAQNGDFEEACIDFRGALQIDPESKDAMFCYGRACKDAYENSEDEEYIARFKSQALNCFERLTLMAPDFDMGFYYLGFSYLNLGLYLKAKLTFESFMKLSEDEDLRKEVSGFLIKLQEPVKIESGCNEILRGDFRRGVDKLSVYRDDKRFNTWWPLWYYLGIGYEGLGDAEQSEACFLEVLKLSPSNEEAMKELIEIYQVTGQPQKVEKYKKKIETVRRNKELDREERRAGEKGGPVS